MSAAFSISKSPFHFVKWNRLLRSFSSLGLAERQGSGRLHVVYYGQDNGVLAAQLLVLKPGRYRLRMQVSGDPAGMLSWTVSCARNGPQLAKMPLAASVDGTFIVPGDCAAQRLELAGSAPELSRTVDVTITGLNLMQERPGA